MATQLTQNIIYQFSDDNGLLVGGKVYFYEAGSTTIFRPIYVDASETAELDNPIILDDLGSFGTTVVYLSGNYNIVIEDKDGVEKRSRDNLDATQASTSLTDWILNAQDARAILGSWTQVKAEGLVTLVSGDVVLGDSNRNMYELRTGGDSNLNPESDVYDENTGIGTEWNNLSIQNAPIKQEDLDVLQAEIDANTANIATPYGMITSNNALDPANDIDITEGVRRDSTQTQNIFVSATTKATDAAFGLGSGQGGMPSGLLPKTNDTFYGVFAIKNPTTGTTDIGFDTSPTAINLLAAANAIEAGFTLYQKIDFFKTSELSNSNEQKNQYDNFNYWKTAISTTVTRSTTAQSIQVAAPPNTIAILDVKASAGAPSTVGCIDLVTSLDMEDVAPSLDNYTVTGIDFSSDWANTQSNEVLIRTDDLSQVRVRSSRASQIVDLICRGYIYNRGIG